MKYKPPIIEIHGDRFEVDFNRDVLRLVENRDHVLPFYHMEYVGESAFHRVRYDTIAKERYIVPEQAERLAAHVIYVEIPVKERLDLVAAARFLGYRDSEIYPPFFQENLVEKQARILPKVLIRDDEFFLDQRQKVFIDSLDSHNRIHFDHLFESKKTGELFIDYNPKTRNAVAEGSWNDPDIQSVIVNLQPFKLIDPVGWEIARQPPGPAETKEEIKRKLWKVFGRDQPVRTRHPFKPRH